MPLKAIVKFTPGNTAGLLARVTTGLRAGMTDAVVIVADEARALCPVDTGALRDSITGEILTGVAAAQRGGPLSSSLFSVVGEVSANTDYASYVEYGTGARGAASPGAGPFPYKASWPGMPAQPYMRPALDTTADDVLAALTDGVKEALG